MKDVDRAAAIRGKTIRFAWTEGPTKGKTHEHVFHQDGTVTWSDADTSKTAQPSGSAAAAKGYTLTVVLNFHDQQLVGFVSSGKEWYPVRGTLQVVKTQRPL